MTGSRESLVRTPTGRASAFPLARGRDAERALYELREARRDGYFLDRFKVQDLRAEHDLDPLRSRSEFEAVTVGGGAR
jgi:hypothetical protein